MVEKLRRKLNGTIDSELQWKPWDPLGNRLEASTHWCVTRTEALVIKRIGQLHV